MRTKPNSTEQPSVRPRFDRRRFISQVGALALMPNLIVSGLGACQRHEPLLRVGTNLWLGYELIYLAQAQGYISHEAVRLVELPSATAVLQALAGGMLEAACLTLDEVLTARADGIDLSVIAVLDVSMGADVLLARPALTTLKKLKGQRIGVEQTALGAVMLDAALRRAGLMVSDVHVVSLTVDQHHDAYLHDAVDALVTFEPVASQVLRHGARRLFSSADIPGRIIDVVAVQRQALARSPAALRQLLAGHFRVRAEFLTQPNALVPILASRLQIDAAQVPAAFSGLELPDIDQNHAWLDQTPSRLDRTAADMAKVMLSAGLLSRAVSVSQLGDARFLPAGPRE
jgi:NitT/TauT family transport system substrate-binding protein